MPHVRTRRFFLNLCARCNECSSFASLEMSFVLLSAPSSAQLCVPEAAKALGLLAAHGAATVHMPFVLCEGVT